MPLLRFKPRPPHLEGAGRASPSRAAPTAPTLPVQQQMVPVQEQTVPLQEQMVPCHPRHCQRLSSFTHSWPLRFAARFLHVLLDLLQSFPLAVLGSHPEAALEARQPRDGHVHAHGVQETHPGALAHTGGGEKRDGLRHAGGETCCQTSCSCQQAPPCVTELQVPCSGCFCQGKALPPGTPLLRAKSIPSAGRQLLKGSCHVPSCNPAASSCFMGCKNISLQRDPTPTCSARQGEHNAGVSMQNGICQNNPEEPMQTIIQVTNCSCRHKATAPQITWMRYCSLMNARSKATLCPTTTLSGQSCLPAQPAPAGLSRGMRSARVRWLDQEYRCSSSRLLHHEYLRNPTAVKNKVGAPRTKSTRCATGC